MKHLRKYNNYTSYISNKTNTLGPDYEINRISTVSMSIYYILNNLSIYESYPIVDIIKPVSYLKFHIINAKKLYFEFFDIHEYLENSTNVLQLSLFLYTWPHVYTAGGSINNKFYEKTLTYNEFYKELTDAEPSNDKFDLFLIAVSNVFNVIYLSYMNIFDIQNIQNFNSSIPSEIKLFINEQNFTKDNLKYYELFFLIIYPEKLEVVKQTYFLNVNEYTELKSHNYWYKIPLKFNSDITIYAACSSDEPQCFIDEVEQENNIEIITDGHREIDNALFHPWEYQFSKATYVKLRDKSYDPNSDEYYYILDPEYQDVVKITDEPIDVSLYQPTQIYQVLRENGELYDTRIDRIKPCLRKGSMILMADGTLKPIEDIQIGDKVQGSEGINTVIWNHAMGYTPDNRYIHYEFTDGKYLDVVGDHRIYDYSKQKFEYISRVDNLKKTIIYEESYPYEIYTTGRNDYYANGILCGKGYSDFKPRWFARLTFHIYKLLFLHKKEYSFANKLHSFISKYILHHTI